MRQALGHEMLIDGISPAVCKSMQGGPGRSALCSRLSYDVQKHISTHPDLQRSGFRSRSPFRIDPVTSELDECALLMIVVLDFPLACLQILQLNLGSSFTLPKFCNLLEEDLPPLQGFAH